MPQVVNGPRSVSRRSSDRLESFSMFAVVTERQSTEFTLRNIHGLLDEKRLAELSAAVSASNLIFGPKMKATPIGYLMSAPALPIRDQVLSEIHDSCVPEMDVSFDALGLIRRTFYDRKIIIPDQDSLPRLQLSAIEIGGVRSHVVLNESRRDLADDLFTLDRDPLILLDILRITRKMVREVTEGLVYSQSKFHGHDISNVDHFALRLIQKACGRAAKKHLQNLDAQVESSEELLFNLIGEYARSEVVRKYSLLKITELGAPSTSVSENAKTLALLYEAVYGTPWIALPQLFQRDLPNDLRLLVITVASKLGYTGFFKKFSDGDILSIELAEDLLHLGCKLLLKGHLPDIDPDLFEGTLDDLINEKTFGLIQTVLDL